MVSEKGPKMSLYKRMEMAGSSYGAMAYQDNVTEFLNSFFRSNDDQRDVMAMMAMDGHGVRSFFLAITKSRIVGEFGRVEVTTN